MRTHGTALFALASILLGGLVASTGCEGVETDDTVADDVTLPGTPAFHSRRHFRGRTGSAGMSGGDGSGTARDAGTPAASCELCATTQQCCEAANVPCTFSVEACTSRTGVARDAYAHNCLVFIKAITGARADPPAVCR